MTPQECPDLPERALQGDLAGYVARRGLAVTLLACRRLGWSTGTTVLAFVASVPPLATVIFERWATHTGRLRVDVLAHRT